MIEEEDNFDASLPTTAPTASQHLPRTPRTEDRPPRTSSPDPYRRRRREFRDRGAVAAELAIAVPVLLLLVLTIVQFAVAEHARHVAQAVAAHAATTARVRDGTAAAGQAAGRQLLQQLGTTLTGAAIDVRRGTDRVTVTVAGSAETVVPGVRLPIRVTSTAPVERVVQPGVGG